MCEVFGLCCVFEFEEWLEMMEIVDVYGVLCVVMVCVLLFVGVNDWMGVFV